MTFWLRENAGLGSALAELFRFTIGGRVRFKSVEKLGIGSDTGILMARAGEDQTERIL
jgi:hypothetical protein